MPTQPGDGHYIVMSFAADWIAGEPILNDELDAFSWVAPELPGELRLTEVCKPSSIRTAARRGLNQGLEALCRSSPPCFHRIEGAYHDGFGPLHA